MKIFRISPELIVQFEKRYAEGYNVQDSTYLAWKDMYHRSPESVLSVATGISNSPSLVSSACGFISSACHATNSTDGTDSLVSVKASAAAPSLKSLQSSEEVLNELLVLPVLAIKDWSEEKAINHKPTEITDATVLQE